MRVCWIVDNKYRDLYNLFLLKEELKKKNINLIIINKFNCLEALDFFKPKFVVIPQISKLGIKILKFSIIRNIKVILANSEGFVTKKKYSTFYPQVDKIEKLTKIFCLTYSEKNFLIDNKYKSKVILSGPLRYYKKNVKKKQKSKIHSVGIVSTNKYLTSRFSEDIIKELYHRHGDDRKTFQKFINYELAFLDFLEKLQNDNKNIKFVLRPHPFEAKKSYRHLNFEIDKSKTSDQFLKKIDLIINDYSTLSLESIINKVPVLNVRKLINAELPQLRDYFPANIGYPVNSMKHLNKILLNKSLNKNKIFSEKKNLKKITSEVPLHLDTIKIMTNYFRDNYEKQHNYFSFFNFFNFIIREIKTFIKVKSDTVYRFYNPNDLKLLKKFSD